MIKTSNRFDAVEVRKDSGPTSGTKTFKFRANDGDFDRMNDRNKVSGWRLSNYNANPIVLFNHDDGSGDMFNPPRPVMPIGRARAYVEGDALMCEIEFDQEDPIAQAAQRKVEKGYLNAVSVRYRLTPGKFRQNDRGGIDSDEQELLEISLVNLPGNQRAVRVKRSEPGRTIDITTPDGQSEFAHAIADATRQKFELDALARQVAEDMKRQLEIDRIAKCVADETARRLKNS